MKRTFIFWAAAILIALIQALLIDIAEHKMNWQKEVREEIITIVHNTYSFDKKQKALILDEIFDRNRTLIFLISIKSFAALTLLFVSFYFFKISVNGRPGKWKSLISVVTLMAIFVLTKIFLIPQFSDSKNTVFLT